MYLKCLGPTLFSITDDYVYSLLKGLLYNKKVFFLMREKKYYKEYCRALYGNANAQVPERQFTVLARADIFKKN